MRRTLLAVGCAVLVSMLLAPHGNKYGVEGFGPFWSVTGFSRCGPGGPLPIWWLGIGRVMIDMLALEIIFLAVLFAVASNLSRRAWRVVSWTAGIVAVAVAACVGFLAFHEQMRTAAEREETTARVLIENGHFDLAKAHLLKASNYWWWKGWWDGARNARERAIDQQAMEKKYTAFQAEKDEDRAGQLLRKRNVFDQFDSSPSFPSDENVKEAKQLLLDAAEKWHAIGNAGEAERVKAWEKNVKTEAEFLASFPDQPANVSTPNAAVREAESRRQWEEQVKEAQSRREWEDEEGQCRAPFPYPPHKWTEVTEFGKTFAIIKFRERKSGDRKKELDGYSKAIGAKFYKQWSRVTQGGADWVEIVFYK